VSGKGGASMLKEEKGKEKAGKDSKRRKTGNIK
jgi:hypothetical protein